MRSTRRRHAHWLRLLLYIIDAATLVVVAHVLPLDPFGLNVYSLYLIFSWFSISFFLGFYEVYRFTPLLKILLLLAKQFFLFGIVVFAFFGLSGRVLKQPLNVMTYLGFSLMLAMLAKLGLFYILKSIRLSGGDYRRVAILGKNSETLKLKKFFEENPVYGYKLYRLFDLNEITEFKSIFDYVQQEQIDEVYGSIAALTNEQILSLTKFADNNLKTLKFLPDHKEIFGKKLDYQYYGISPIVSVRSIPIDQPFNQFLKRVFDILISAVVLLGVLSWLTPLLRLLIKLESKGPVFFKQKRNGLDFREFNCWKFRSMYVNGQADTTLARKDDDRVTRLGKFMRKTSIDELPQFWNVLLGDMSIVGPRPQMLSVNKLYAAHIDRFMVRHLVKPGITGLAQVSGCRGEMRTENDVKKRVGFDIFYLENWSMLMDLHIMAKTLLDILKGDSKAY